MSTEVRQKARTVTTERLFVLKQILLELPRARNQYSLEDKHTSNTYSSEFSPHRMTILFSFPYATTTAKVAAQSVAHRLMFWVTVFARLHYPSKSYCLLTLTPLNTVVLTNSLLCTLQQLNTLYADLHMGISAYWIILDEFNKMMLAKKKKK